jgi:3-oxoacyl-[acyl-carrier-protein] synthase-1
MFESVGKKNRTESICVWFFKEIEMEPVISKYSYINNSFASVNGERFAENNEPEKGKFLTAIYRKLNINYPKFFKMDNLSKLGFLASELILAEGKQRFIPREDGAVICFNRSSSLEADILFQSSIEKDNFFPSPSIFVYTLPNIVAGEIAIRNKFLGETSFYISEKFNPEQIFRTVNIAFQNNKINFVLVSWVESFEKSCEVFMLFVEKNTGKCIIPFSINNIVELLNKVCL